jgi:hypothetical protein
MATKTAAQIAQAWQQGMTAKAANYSAGIQACQVNPMQLAASKVDAAVASYAAAAPRMAANLNATPVGFWKSQSVAAQAKFAAGAAKGMTKYTAAITKMTGGVYQGMKAASQAAGGGAQGAAAAITYLQQAKQNGQTK